MRISWMWALIPLTIEMTETSLRLKHLSGSDGYEIFGTGTHWNYRFVQRCRRCEIPVGNTTVTVRDSDMPVPLSWERYKYISKDLEEIQNGSTNFYQEDCNLSLLEGKTIAIIGYGSQDMPMR